MLALLQTNISANSRVQSGKMKTVEKLQDWASMPVLPSDFIMASYSEATAISPTTSKNTYTADIKRDWCIGVGAYPVSSPSFPVYLTISNGQTAKPNPSSPRRLPNVHRCLRGTTPFPNPPQNPKPTRPHNVPHRIPISDCHRDRHLPNPRAKTRSSILHRPDPTPAIRSLNL